MVRWIWAITALVALLTPAATGTFFDGVPLDGTLEAVLVGFIVPLLIVLDRRAFDRAWVRGVVVLLLAIKMGSAALLTTSGLCTRFETGQAVVGPLEDIAFDEPSGRMRSWDVRAHWGSGTPACSAITRRDYASRSDFPAWFVNLLEVTNPAPRELQLAMNGVVTVAESGHLSIDTAPAMNATLAIDGTTLTSNNGHVEGALEPGSHRVEIRGRVANDDWRVVPTWNGASLWTAALVTVETPTTMDLTLWRVLPLVTAGLTWLLVGAWAAMTVGASPLDGLSLAGVAAIAVAMCATAWAPSVSRFAPLLLGLVVLLPAARRAVTWRIAAWLIALPWLALAGGLAAQQIGEFSHYSRGDDWLSYQIAAYRIYLYGYWLEAGERLFYYQPLYRWIAGALHLIFGDSSAGEIFWDAVCLSVGAILAFAVVRPALGGRYALLASVLTLALFTLTPIWYFVGRGLAEISAAGFAWAAALMLIHARTGHVRSVVAGGVLAVLAFYARLNHMLFAGALLVFLLPLDASSRALRSPVSLLRSLRIGMAATYVAILGIGVALLGLRAWHYTGEFNPFAGTSFGLNHTGLGPTTLFSPLVWKNVSHSLFAQTIVNETFDLRGVPVLAGCVAAVLAVLQVPGFSRVPVVAAGAVLGALAGALVAHAHGYPGRFSVHLVPLSTATILLAVGLLAWRHVSLRAATAAAMTSPETTHASSVR